MFSKLMIASSAYLTADAIKVSTKHKSHAGINTSCGANIARLTSPHETQDFAKYSGGSTLYEDPDMPANVQALYWGDHLRPGSGAGMKQTLDTKVTGWARPSEILKSQERCTPPVCPQCSGSAYEGSVGNSPSLWGSNGVTPNGTRQGTLGDCWFLASAAALAEYPDRIKKVFTNQSYDSAGIFQVTFHSEGVPIKITVDDRLPVVKDLRNEKWLQYGSENTIMAGMSTNGAWWVPILEKAYSKFNVNYAQLSGGQAEVALRHLTDMPALSWKRGQQTTDEMYATMDEADRKKWVMTASTDSGYAGLVGGHVYTVLGVYELVGGPKVLKMRNPWSSETYTGRYRDDDPAWTAAQKTQVGHTVADDGVFFMPAEDFSNGFSDYDVLMYQDWQVDKVEMQSNGEKKAIKSFTSPVDQEFIITVEYQNPRLTEAGCEPSAAPFFNVYIDSGNPLVVQTYDSYGAFKVQAQAGKAHEFKIINWGAVEVNQHYIMRTWANSSKVIWG